LLTRTSRRRNRSTAASISPHVGRDGDVGLDRYRLRSLVRALGGDLLRIALVGNDEARTFLGE
jgi:hypothetical protein